MKIAPTIRTIRRPEKVPYQTYDGVRRRSPMVWYGQVKISYLFYKLFICPVISIGATQSLLQEGKQDRHNNDSL
jgi:hypothetical protein